MMMHPILFRVTVVALASLSTAFVACSGNAGSEDPVVSSSSALTPAAVSGADGGLACNGPLPEICEWCPDHTRACARWVEEDGHCQVQICPAHRAPIDCQGTLPGGVCVVCSDGNPACPHWQLVDGGCELEICPPAPIPTETPVKGL